MHIGDQAAGGEDGGSVSGRGGEARMLVGEAVRRRRDLATEAGEG